MYIQGLCGHVLVLHVCPRVMQTRSMQTCTCATYISRGYANVYMLRIVVHIIYFHVLLFLAHCPHPSPPFPKSCHGNYSCIFLNCTDIYGDTSLFAVILMAYTICVLLHNTCVAMKLYLCLPYYDYG